MRPFVAGITGGIASGKSAVSDILESHGAYIIDTDVLSREVIAPGTEGEAALKAAFPEAYRGGALDRAALGKVVFSSPEARARLNAVTHPLIRAAAEERIESCGKTLAFLVVPLMFEAGFDTLCDCTVAVSAPYETRISRLIKRNNIPRERAEAMIAAQMDEAERVSRADYVLPNDGDMGVLRARVEELYCAITDRANAVRRAE